MQFYKKIHAYPPSHDNKGYEITYSTNSSRKTFHLPPSATKANPAPVASESFSLDQNEYFKLLERVEALYK